MGPGLEDSPEMAGSDRTSSTDVSPGTVDTDQGATGHLRNENLVHTKLKAHCKPEHRGTTAECTTGAGWCHQ